MMANNVFIKTVKTIKLQKKTADLEEKNEKLMF